MAEQILIEFIGDASQLQPAVDVLEQMGQIDAKAADSFRKSNAELTKKVDAFKKVNTEAGKQIKTLKDVETGVNNLSDAFSDALGDSVLKGITDVSDKMATLQKRAKETGKSVLEIVAAQEQLKQKLAQSQALGPFQKMAESVKVAEQKVLSLAAKLNNLQSKGINDGQLFDRLTKELPEAQAELDKLRKQYDAVTASIDKNRTATTELNSSEESLKQQLREMTAQLAQMELAGQRNTAEYNQLVAKAGEVKDAINDASAAIANAGSDTRGFDNLISLAGGVAGGFAVAQGAVALFGEENEEVQKILLKVNAAMAILQGLQQIQNLLTLRQFASMSALLGLQRVQLLQTQLQTGAESSYVVVRYLAIGAQKLLNAVMLANPLGLALVAVTAIAAAWKLFSSNALSAADAQKKLNEEIEFSIKLNDELVDAVKKGGDANLARLKRDNASAETIRKAQEKNLQEQSEQVQASLDKQRQAYVDADNKRKEIVAGRVKADADEIQELQKTVDAYVATQKKKFDIEDQLEILQINNEGERRKERLANSTAFAEAQVQIDREGSRQQLVDQIAAIRAKEQEELKSAARLPGEVAKIRAQANREAQKVINEIKIFDLTEQRDIMQAKLATIKEGSIAELEEQKKIAAKTVEIEAAAFGISRDRKRAILAEGAKDQEEFNRQIRERSLQQDQARLETSLAKVKEGSAEEFNLKLDLLKNQEQVELNSKGVTDDKKKLIEAKYLKDVETLTKETNKRIADEAINIKQAEINAKLAALQNKGTSETDTDVLQLKKESIDQQQQLDIVAANFSINNEDLKQAKIKEIIAKANADKLALDQEYKLAVINIQTELANAELENEKKRSQLSAGSGVAGRIQAQKQIHDLTLQQINNEAQANEDSYAKSLITYEEYLKKKAELDGKYLDLKLEKEQEKEQIRQEIVQGSLQILQQFYDAYFEMQAASRQADLDKALSALDAHKQAELDVKNLTEQQKERINIKYAAKERELKLKAFEEDKKAKRSQAIINGLLGITNAIATAPNIIAGLILAGVVATSTAINVAKINATQPGFKKGTRNAPRGYAWVGEEGPELVYLKGGEKIYTYHESKTIASTWEKNTYQTPYEVIASNIPSAADQQIISNSYVNNTGSLVLDYEKLGKTISKHIPAPVSNSINMDENGFSKHIIDQGNKTEIRNSRYKMN